VFRLKRHDYGLIYPPNNKQSKHRHVNKIRIDDMRITYAAKSFTPIIAELNAKLGRSSLWFVAIASLYVPSIGIFLALYIFFIVRKRRKRTIIMYDMSTDAALAVRTFYRSFEPLIASNSAWYVLGEEDIANKKYHGGAEKSINKLRIQVGYNTPKYVETNVKVPCIPLGKQKLYFFPDYILIYAAREVRYFAYSELHIRLKHSEIIVESNVPRDSKIVGYTWQHVNKSGQPDLRFKDNRRLPIIKCAELYFMSSGGFAELLMFSDKDAGQSLITQLEKYKKVAFLQREKRAVGSVVAADGDEKSVQAMPVVDSDSTFATVELADQIAIRQYRAEPIDRLKQGIGRLLGPYAMFQKMRRIAIAGDERAETFVRQAEFMAAFTDDYEQVAPLDTYYSVYAKMNNQQLRTYFTWRTKVRAGTIEEIDLSYVYCYIFELINNIGMTTYETQLSELLAFWQIYRVFNQKIDYYLMLWLRDYYVEYHEFLPHPFTAYASQFPLPYRVESVELLAQIEGLTFTSLSAIEMCSSFKISTGKFYRSGEQALIDDCVCFIMQAIDKAFTARGLTLKKLFVTKEKESMYNLYQEAVHPLVRRKNADVVVLDAFETIGYDVDEGWYRTYLSISEYKPIVGYMMKMIEVSLREQFGYKRKLKLPEQSVLANCFWRSEQSAHRLPINLQTNQLATWKQQTMDFITDTQFKTVIEQAIGTFLTENHISIVAGIITVQKPVKVNMNEIRAIEDDANEIAAKLEQDVSMPEPLTMTDNTETVETVAVFNEAVTGEKGFVALWQALNKEEKELVQMLWAGEAVKSNNELLIETINEKSFVAIDDNLIDYGGGTPYIYEEYVGNVAEVLGGR